MSSLTPPPSVSKATALLHRAVALRDAIQNQVVENDSKIKALENEEQLLELVAALIKRLIDEEVTDGVSAIEKLQTEGLQEIFYDQNLSVKTELDEQRGKISVTMYTVEKREDGTEIQGMSDDLFGGAVLTMEEVFMRISVIYRRGLRPFLIMDETLAAVADKYVDRAAGFLSTLCERLGFDMLLISHDDAVVGAAQTAYQVDKVGTKAKFKPLVRKASE